MAEALRQRLNARLRLPIFVAPMFLISGPELVTAAGRAGVLGALPAANARTIDELARWFAQIAHDLGAVGRADMWAVNMVVHPTYDRFAAELDLICEHKPGIVITALGSPRRPLESVHAYGGAVFADVVSPDQARKAADAGADGLILVASGAGGHTGRYSALAFVEEVRAFWAGPLVLGGAIGSASGIRAAISLGADFAYMGTRFIAVLESLVSDDNRAMLVHASMADIVTTAAVSGVSANWMRASLDRAGFTGAMLEEKARIDFSELLDDSRAWKNIWGAGHAVGSTRSVQSVAELIDDLVADYAALASLPVWPREIAS